MHVVLAVLLFTALTFSVRSAQAATGGAGGYNSGTAMSGSMNQATATPTAPTACGAPVDPRFVAAMKAYNEKRFPECIDNFERLIRAHPKDARLHYYLANAYMAAGKLQLAEREYLSSMYLTSDTQLTAFCQTAVSQLRQHLANLPPVGAVAATPATPAVSSKLQLNTRLLQDQEQHLKTRFTLEAKERERLYDRIAQTQIQGIKQNAKDQIASLVKRRGGSSAYKDEVDCINATAETQIARVKIEAGYKKDRSHNELKRQTNCIDSYDDHLRKLLASDTGSIRVMPTGTSLYVRNYINFGEDTTPLLPGRHYVQPAAVSQTPSHPVVQELRAKQFKFKSVK